MMNVTFDELTKQPPPTTANFAPIYNSVSEDIENEIDYDDKSLWDYKQRKSHSDIVSHHHNNHIHSLGNNLDRVFNESANDVCVVVYCVCVGISSVFIEQTIRLIYYLNWVHLVDGWEV
jgi:hypothetical protein